MTPAFGLGHQGGRCTIASRGPGEETDSTGVGRRFSGDSRPLRSLWAASQGCPAGTCVWKSGVPAGKKETWERSCQRWTLEPWFERDHAGRWVRMRNLGRPAVEGPRGGRPDRGGKVNSLGALGTEGSRLCLSGGDRRVTALTGQPRRWGVI